MEVKVWVDGIQRVICGVSEKTTCQDIVLALAHATGRTGRFTLIEKWRDNQRPLAPGEQPLLVLQKWGEYATDVQFLLLQSDSGGFKTPSKSNAPQTKKDSFTHNFSPTHTGDPSIKRSFTFSGAHSGNSLTCPPRKRERFRDKLHESSVSEESEIGSSLTTSPVSSSSAKTSSPSTNHQPSGALFSSNHKSETVEQNHRRKSSHPSVLTRSNKSTSNHVTNSTPIPKPRVHRGNVSNTNGPKSLDSYLSHNSPPDFQEARSSSPLPEFEEYDLDKNFPPSNGRSGHVKTEEAVTSDDTQEYSSLVRLVSLQQERLQLQESQINMIESEIKMLEERGKADEVRLKELESEIHTWEGKHGEFESELLEISGTRWQEQLDTEIVSEQNLLTQKESIQNQIVQAELELKKLNTNKDTIVIQIETMQKEIAINEQKAQQGELLTVQEVADVQKEINVRLIQHEEEHLKMEELSKELKELETTILEKKVEIADLENTLKEANLQQFVVTPPSTPTLGIRPLEDGKTGESALFKQLSRPTNVRKHAVSPQDFTSKVTTSENPDGVWV